MIGQSQNALQTSMERLSSGLRMTASITGLAQAQRNAEGSLNQINDNLQRIRELTVQAQNGTNSASDIDSIQQEVNQRLEEIDRIARETDFNGTNVLNVTEETNISIQVGGQDRKVAALGFDVRSAVVAGDGTATDGNIYARFDDSGTPTYLQITEDPSATGVFAQDFGTDSGVTEPTGFAAFNADDVVVADGSAPAEGGSVLSWVLSRTASKTPSPTSLPLVRVSKMPTTRWKWPT